MFGLLRSQFLYNVSILKRRMAYYAVAHGRQVGIYDSWAQCQQQVNGFKGAIYKKFNTRQEAEQFINPPMYQVAANGVPRQEHQQNRHEAKPKDFWPEDVVEQQEVTDEDLARVMEEVEGLPTQSGSRKRKAQTNSSGNYKIPRHMSNADEPVALKKFGAFEFTMNAEGYVIVYTDGSCLGNGRKDACAGFGVYFGDNHQLNAAKPVLGRVTNNVGEIQAAIYAIKTALDLGITKLSINTDSQFLINSITKWVPGWKKRGWRLPSMEPVKNVVDFKELDELLQKNEVQVNWNYVEAHKGIKGNEMADKLARQGSQLYKELNFKN
ncbi:ribonuclease H1 [Drosophila montana]|uniref:ribonuclease H1 n=1 Tax=Drosophila montana TaxID=40370 RepID=UPI00313A8C37